MKILLTGYYGFGNFGDDLLFISNYKLIKKLFPNSQIDIYTEASEPQYLKKMLNEDLKILNYSSNGNYDYIWHGGGGVFFDFKKGKISSLIINFFIRSFGVGVYSNLYETFRKIAKKPVIKFRSRVGFGLGVGTFTNSSNRFRDAVYKLSGFSLLVVRDKQSIFQANKLNSRIKLKQSTDIVFDKSLWMPASNHLAQREDKDSTIGIILRDWKMEDGYDYLPDFVKLADLLSEKGYKIKCFAFDASTDSNYISIFQSAGYDVKVWQPSISSIGEMLSFLSSLDYCITSRFHGAIIGACLGVPGMCINIEYKLQSAVDMLKGSYNLLSIPIDNIKAVELIENDLQNLNEMKSLTHVATSENIKMLSEAYTYVLEELNKDRRKFQ